VDNSVWLQELSMKKRNILKGLQRELGKDKISDIQFKIGEF
jgi:predicted nucleic acid-binding Zn ribbon protein